MRGIISSWFIQDMVKVTGDMWRKGWGEHHCGNISLRLQAREVEVYHHDFYTKPLNVSLAQPVPELANRWFLVTGSNTFFRNIELAPAENLVLLKVSADGQSYQIHWGLTLGGLPTSALATHFQSHIARMQVNDSSHRVIMYCHATNLISLSYIQELDNARFTRLLWGGNTECLMVFPDGIGIVPWANLNTVNIGMQTAEQMREHRLVLWPFHGVFASGSTLDNTFGLINTAEKSAEIMVKVLSIGGKKKTISREQLIALAKHFGVTPMAAALGD